MILTPQQQDEIRRVLETMRAVERAKYAELAAAHQTVRALELVLDQVAQSPVGGEAELQAVRLVAQADPTPPRPAAKRRQAASPRRLSPPRVTSGSGKFDQVILRALKGRQLRCSEVAREAGLPGDQERATVRAHGALQSLLARGLVVRHGKLYGLPSAAKPAPPPATDVVWNGAAKKSLVNGAPLSEASA